MIAFEAAYRGGAEWLSELMAYLQATRDEAIAFIRAHIPKINAVCPEGTYLLWLDCRKLNLDDKALALFFVQEAKLGLSSGAMFGRGSKGFMRMNIGTPRVNVMKALDRLKSALS
jgi:cystathionine beta-lyase